MDRSFFRGVMRGSERVAPFARRLRVLALVCLLVGSTALGAHAAAPEPSAFCRALERVNTGEVDTSELAELEGHAHIVGVLLEAAPKKIRADLTVLRDTFAAWANAVRGETPMMKTFAILRDPELAGVQGRIADFIAEDCGLRLGDGRYHVGTEASRSSRCPGWSSIGNPMTFNHFPNLPDISGGNYFAQRFWSTEKGGAPPGMFEVPPGGRVKYHGQYSRARYFAYHPNDEDLNNLKTLRDVDLDPDPGSVNPFREIPEPNTKNYYTAWLDFDRPPANPAANTSYVGARRDGIKRNRWVWNMLRLYASDLGNGPNTGGVPLPAMTIYDAQGDELAHYDECQPFEPDEAHPKTDMLFPSLPIADHRAVSARPWSTSSNFDSPSDTLANADVQYLATFFSHHHGNILVVRARMLETANSRAGEPISTPGQDIRLFTLCTYNIWSGSARQCMLDHDLRVDDGGFYTVVVAEESHRPGNLEAVDATWIDWGPYLDGQLTYRMLYRENDFISRIAFALNGGYVPEEMASYVPTAVACTRERFESAGWRGCFEDAGVDTAPYR